MLEENTHTYPWEDLTHTDVHSIVFEIAEMSMAHNEPMAFV